MKYLVVCEAVPKKEVLTQFQQGIIEYYGKSCQNPDDNCK
jgi:hypothetical protein